MTYTDLRTLLASYLARNDLGSLIDGWIEQAEAKFNRVLRTPYQEETAYADMSAEYISVPDNMLAIRAMVRDSDGRLMQYQRPIDYRNVIDDDPLSGESSNTDTVEPIWTAEDMQFRVYPHPTTTDTLRVRILFYAKIPALSSSNETNWLLTDHPDLYVAQCCLNGALAIKATPDQVGNWKATADEALATLRGQRLEAMTAKNLRTEIGAGGGFNIATGWR